MEAKDQFIEWLKNKVLQNPAEPPAASWQEIAHGLDLEDNWNEINEELELDELWHKLDARLDYHDYLIRFEKFSYGLSAAAILLLLLNFFYQPSSLPIPQLGREEMGNIPLYVSGDPEEELKGNAINEGRDVNDKYTISAIAPKKDLGPDQENGNGRETKKEIQHRPENELKTVAEFKTEPEFKKGSEPGHSALSDAAVQNAKEEVKQANDALVNGIVRNEAFGSGIVRNGIQESSQGAPFYPSLQPVGFMLEVEAPQQVLPSDIVLIPEQKSMSAFEHYPVSYIGIGSALKLSSLLNSKTLHAMERTSLLSSAPSWHQDLSILYGHRLAERLYVQGEFFLINKAGQQYNEYRKGIYAGFRDELSYQTAALNLSWLRRQLGYGKFPIYVRWTGGLYAGRLLAATEYSELGNISRMDEYTRFHAGMLAGYEYDVFLHKKLMLSYGIRSRIDMMNIYAGTENIPAAFRKTKAASLDFSLSLKYLIRE